MDPLDEESEITHGPDEDPVEASHEIDERLKDSPALVDMSISLKRLRSIALALSILVGVSVVFAGVALYAAIRSNTAAQQASQSLSQQHATCIANNDFRKQDHKRWLYIESLVTRNLPPNEEAFVRKFEQYIAKTDQLRDCSKVK
jgi:hypothetical protein